MRPSPAGAALRTGLAAVLVAGVAGGCAGVTSFSSGPHPLPAASLGVSAVTATDPDGKPIGARIVSVDRLGAAYSAGVKPGDVIVRNEQFPISTAQDLQARVADLHPGQDMRLTLLWRPGETVTATLGWAH
ncbi:PDZ domain-containing protein [Pseudonocardia acidicola]|uniref:PDZ domain-containing protein n=1 Tax=Pseudonocardia acidicola TaxID=2724939 RepID=A0ABX1S726_9PSEU|nr:PDZ domain-containing protein [Pseudonocardia acidicola]NMH96734.1 PDZ domain-containing protein [Pseudonocardia acidicola]